MYQQRFKNSLTHLFVFWNRLKWCCPLRHWGWSVISGSTNVLFIDQITEVSCRGWWWFTGKKATFPYLLALCRVLWNLVRLDLGGWIRVFQRLYGCLNVKATPHFHAFSKIKAHQHQLAFKCSPRGPDAVEQTPARNSAFFNHFHAHYLFHTIHKSMKVSQSQIKPQTATPNRNRMHSVL